MFRSVYCVWGTACSVFRGCDFLETKIIQFSSWETQVLSVLWEVLVLKHQPVCTWLGHKVAHCQQSAAGLISNFFFHHRLTWFPKMVLSFFPTPLQSAHERMGIWRHNFPGIKSLSFQWIFSSVLKVPEIKYLPPSCLAWRRHRRENLCYGVFRTGIRVPFSKLRVLHFTKTPPSR